MRKKKPHSLELSYPLVWPNGFTRSKNTETARFRKTLKEAKSDLSNELRLLGAQYSVCTSNLKIKNASIFDSSDDNEPKDTAVAVYFDLNSSNTCIPCDRWDLVVDNISAIAATIKAMRGINRWGTGAMVKRTFQAFQALPAVGQDWRSVFGVDHRATLDEVKAIYREMARKCHSDLGATNDVGMQRLNLAWECAKKDLE